MALSKNSRFAKTGGRFFEILWPSYNVLTLTFWIRLYVTNQGPIKCHFEIARNLKSMCDFIYPSFYQESLYQIT